MLMTEEPRRRLSVRSNNLVLPYIDLTPTIRSVPVGPSDGSVLQAKVGVARPTAFQRSDLRRCGPVNMGEFVRSQNVKRYSRLLKRVTDK